MRPPKGSSLATKFEKNTERIYKWSIVAGLVLSGLALLILFICVLFDARPEALISFVGTVIDFATVVVAAGLLAGVAGMVYGMVTLHKFVHLYFIECVRSDAAHAAVLRTFTPADLQTTRQVLELEITRQRNRLNVFAGSPDKLSILAVYALSWAAYATLEPYLSHGTFDVSSPKNWAVAALVIAGLLLSGAVIGTLIMNVRVQRLTYQTQLLDIATNTAL